jgi:hypothetical protein
MRILLATLALYLSGCLHTVKSTHDSDCARAGQYYEGFTIVTEDGRGVARCAKPKNEKEQCLVEHHQSMLVKSGEINQKYNTKNTLIVAVYIVPGAAMYYAWKDENEKDLQNYVTEESKSLQKCNATAH